MRPSAGESETLLSRDVMVSSVSRLLWWKKCLEVIVIKSALFFSCSSKAERRELQSPHVPIILRVLKVLAHAVSGKGEPGSGVCETAAATAGSKSDVWKHFGFPVSRNLKGEKRDRQTKIKNTLTLLVLCRIQHPCGEKQPSLRQRMFQDGRLNQQAFNHR